MAQVGNTRTVVRNWSTLIRLADPDHEKDKRKELVYEFTNGKVTRKFYERRPYEQPEAASPVDDPI